MRSLPCQPRTVPCWNSLIENLLARGQTTTGRWALVVGTSILRTGLQKNQRSLGGANCGRADESTLSMSQSTSNKMTHQKILRSSHSGNCPLQTPPTRPSVACCLVAITRPRVVTHLPTMMRLWLLQETPAAELLRRNVRFPPFLLLLTLKNSRWKLLCCCYLHVV